MADYKSALQEVRNLITFADVTHVEDQGRVIVHEYKGRKFGISTRRLDQSSCAEDVVLHVSDDGKWLIPADTVRGEITVNW